MSIFLPQNSRYPLKTWTLQPKNQKPSYLWGFWNFLVRTPTSPNLKTHKRIILHNRNYIACKVYTYPITYISFIKIKGPFWIHSLPFTHFTHFTSLPSLHFPRPAGKGSTRTEGLGAHGLGVHGLGVHDFCTKNSNQLRSNWSCDTKNRKTP